MWKINSFLNEFIQYKNEFFSVKKTTLKAFKFLLENFCFKKGNHKTVD